MAERLLNVGDQAPDFTAITDTGATTSRSDTAGDRRVADAGA